MSTNNIRFCKEVDKSTLVVISPKITKLLDCALTGACVVIRSNTQSKKLQCTNTKDKYSIVNLYHFQGLFS